MHRVRVYVLITCLAFLCTLIMFVCGAPCGAKFDKAISLRNHQAKCSLYKDTEINDARRHRETRKRLKERKAQRSSKEAAQRANEGRSERCSPDEVQVSFVS